MWHYFQYTLFNHVPFYIEHIPSTIFCLRYTSVTFVTQYFCYIMERCVSIRSTSFQNAFSVHWDRFYMILVMETPSAGALMVVESTSANTGHFPKVSIWFSFGNFFQNQFIMFSECSTLTNKVITVLKPFCELQNPIFSYDYNDNWQETFSKGHMMHTNAFLLSFHYLQWENKPNQIPLEPKCKISLI